MYRKLVPFAVAIVLAVGCGKKPKESDSGGSGSGGGGGDGGGGGAPAPSAPTFTIKFRDEQKGDKFVVVETKSSTLSVKANTPKGPVAQSQKSTEKTEYTETVFERPAGAESPTRATRNYKVAETQTVGGPARPASYSRRLVLVEKRGSGYSFTVDGAPLPKDEDKTLRDEYEKQLTAADILPKKPVQVNEKWALDQDVLKKFTTGREDAPVNVEKSSGSGRLLRTYTKNGQQWGTIEIQGDVVLEGTSPGGPVNGSMSMTTTIDTAIDGSSLNETMKKKATAKLTIKSAKGDVELTIDADEDWTRTSLK